jgi:hypothetical protein
MLQFRSSRHAIAAALLASVGTALSYNRFDGEGASNDHV